jgi:hypothetical protein
MLEPRFNSAVCDPAGIGHATGVAYRSSLRLPGIAGRDQTTGEPSPTVVLEMIGVRAVEASWSGAAGPPLWQTVFSDGAAYKIERGVAGDHLFTYADRALFHLDAERAVLLCAPADPADHRWQRVLLDDIFYAVSALHGFALLHCSAVVTPRGVVAICAATGGGKTTLATRLVERGLPLFCDDLLALKPGPDGPVGHPGPAVMSIARADYERNCLPAGRVLGRLAGEDEVWVEVDSAASWPQRLVALVVMSRLPGVEPSITARAGSVIELLPYAIGMDLDPERRAQKFHALSDVAVQVKSYDLRIPVDFPAAEAASLVESATVGERVGQR